MEWRTNHSPKLVNIFSGESGASVLLDVWEGAKFIPDEEGLEVAEYEAARAAAEISRDRLPKGDAREVRVESNFG
jgi:hypothetical protein